MSDALPLSLLNSWDVTSEVNAVPKQWGKVIQKVMRVCYLGRREGEGREKNSLYIELFWYSIHLDVTSQLNSRERGGASDTKNPDLYY